MTALQLPPTELPDPHPPSGRKRDLYYDPAVFKELDEDVFKVCLFIFIFLQKQMRDLIRLEFAPIFSQFGFVGTS